MQFTDIFVGWPGSVHDARVLKNSPVFSNHEDLFQHDTHILGDAAYPATRYHILVFKFSRQQCIYKLLWLLPYS